MAVYKRTYKTYDAALTPAWSRFLIVTRAAYGHLSDSKFLRPVGRQDKMSIWFLRWLK